MYQIYVQTSICIKKYTCVGNCIWITELSNSWIREVIYFEGAVINCLYFAGSVLLIPKIYVAKEPKGTAVIKKN